MQISDGLSSSAGVLDPAVLIAPQAADAIPRRPSAYCLRSRIAGRVCAALLMIPCGPIIAVLVGLIRLTSPGPAIFSQKRVGLEGRLITIYKLRTMHIDAEAVSGPAWASQKDPRVTRLGRILRKLHLDELPQLWNVLRGDMALIGPRPERPEFVQCLAVKIPNYLDRLSILPGITGLAQIRLPPDANLEGVRLKLRQDLEYIEKAGPVLDLRILFCTALRVTGMPGQWASRAVGLHRNGDAALPETCPKTITPLSSLDELHARDSAADSRPRKPR